MKFVEVPVIGSDKDHDFASRRLHTILSPSSKVLKKDPDQIRAMAVLIHHYIASKSVGQKFPDPISAIKFRMEQMGLEASDLVPYLGSQATVSRVLSRKQNLTLQMIRKLHKHLEIPADALIQPTRHWGKKKEPEQPK